MGKVKNEMLIYKADNKTVIATINNQAKVIKLLEENNKLKDKVRKLNNECAELEEALYTHPNEY